jgi:hypothetical protein
MSFLSSFDFFLPFQVQLRPLITLSLSQSRPHARFLPSIRSIRLPYIHASRFNSLTLPCIEHLATLTTAHARLRTHLRTSYSMLRVFSDLLSFPLFIMVVGRWLNYMREQTIMYLSQRPTTIITSSAESPLSCVPVVSGG